LLRRFVLNHAALDTAVFIGSVVSLMSTGIEQALIVCLQDSNQQQQAQLQVLEQLLAQSKQQAEQQQVWKRWYAPRNLSDCTQRRQLLWLGMLIGANHASNGELRCAWSPYAVHTCLPVLLPCFGRKRLPPFKSSLQECKPKAAGQQHRINIRRQAA
jgi:hypothetical protein